MKCEQVEHVHLLYSEHWKRKGRYRNDVTDKLLELAISKGAKARDHRWENAYNTLIKVPGSGRTLKVVYRRLGPESYKIITAYWLD